MLGLRVGTKPCLQKHLYEPAVFTQREFLQGVTRAPGSAHSSMSEETGEKNPQAIFKDLIKSEQKKKQKTRNVKR